MSAATSMKTLLDNLKTVFENGILAGRITAPAGATGVTVFKGLRQDPTQVAFTQYPYIAIDDGGERIEANPAGETQTRFFSVLLEVGYFDVEEESALDGMLDFFDKVKAEIERIDNRQMDGYTFGVTVQTYEWAQERNFYRGRIATIEFYLTEDREDF